VQYQSRLIRGSKSMSLGLESNPLADALKLLGKHIQDPVTVAAKQTAPDAIQSITMALERADEEIGRRTTKCSDGLIAHFVRSTRTCAIFLW
jgi:hypothetical protein